ncbi:Transmembrane protein 87A like protein [Argiope bruennichi]|uniref:Transmembrane protein 87A like protein n=1 Tax=Argiope bruennichi TaxID=94029 RepID=A0A8T0FIC6_ARGBR|nr:Transmembrane protein 87A like protein [Argiope bruennichi]
MICVLYFSNVLCFPDPGQWSASSVKESFAIFGSHKPLYGGSSIHVSVNCEPHAMHQKVEVQWVLRQTSCYEDYLASDVYTQDILRQYFICPMSTNSFPKIRFFISKPVILECSNRIHLEVSAQNRSKRSAYPQDITSAKMNFARINNKNESLSDQDSLGHLYGPFSSASSVKLGSKLTSVDMDGIYLFILKIESVDKKIFNVSVDIAMKSDYGYLSAVDYPLLIFYGVMCGLYVIYAIVWLILSALQWRDLLRIQFWIGAVILLGLMEKAVFYAEYQSINFTGQSVQGAILFAEILSCMKRTLARMLIIIVSLGFGIVKPRLGPTLHRIVGVGALYFGFGTIEGCLRVLKPKTDPGNQALMAGVPLAVTDSGICWWIFSSLVQTIRTLRLRRNIVKLQLYRHFTNTLIMAVIGSVAFMTWSIHAHKLSTCITDWKELWVDEAYWHFLFSTILFVIMILWRPTNNNQRYAFTPLLDAMDDDEDDEENLLPNDAFAGMKMRTPKNNTNSPHIEDVKSKQDEDLKWVEENIPTSLTDVALPSLLDSDEEIMTAKFERSKME